MSELREAAQAVGAWAVECDGALVDVYLTETAAKLVAENMHEANRGRDFVWRVVPLVRRTHPPRDEWRLASEPPEDDRSVLVWMPGKLGGLAIGRCSRGNWSPYYLGSPVTHWRDVTPPTEGAR